MLKKEDNESITFAKQIKRYVRVGGVVVLDNMLWGGSVLKPGDENSISIRKTGDFIQNDNRCSNFLLPIRDGIMVCIKK